MNSRVETLILHSLINRETYTRKTLPFIDGKFFSIKKERFLFERIKEYFEKYNVTPTPEVLSIAVSEATGITEQEEEDILEYLNELYDLENDDKNEEWLIVETEKFCQDRAIHNAILSSINIINGENKKLDKGSIPKILSDALAVSFDTNVGHDYVNDAEARFEFYHRKEKKVPFDIESFNKITKGGVTPKTLNVAIAATGVGKSLAMCHFAAGNLSLGHNVLYITLEMSEERIAERIDANLLDVNISELEEMPKMMYDRKVKRMRENVTGRLMIKEYPTASAHAGHFRALLDELKLKKNFIPDIVYIDYLNIAASSRLRMGSNVNTYSYIKSIAEELRGLAVEYNVPIVSATQTNRTGAGSSDVEMTDTSESYGLPMTVDLLFAIISSDEFQERGQFLVKQLKNRYQDITYMKRFMVGVEYSKMRLYELEKPLEGLYENSQSDNKTKPEQSEREYSGTRRARRGRFDDFE